METNRPVFELIRERTSWRSYEARPVEEDTFAQIAAFAEDQTTGPFGTGLRFLVTPAKEEDGAALKKLGTYGIIKNPFGFVVGAARKTGKGLEDYGYAMEKIILKLTDHNLGTCWLGGTFSKGGFAQRIGKTPEEIVPAVCSFGYRTNKRGKLDTLMRMGAGSRKRLEFNKLFFRPDFSGPLSQNAGGRDLSSLEMVRIGPSASNKQPWRMVVSEDGKAFHLFLERTPGYGEKNEKYFGMADLQRVDMGIAMCHFELAQNETGNPGLWIEEPPEFDYSGRQYVVTWKARA